MTRNAAVRSADRAVRPLTRTRGPLLWLALAGLSACTQPSAAAPETPKDNSVMTATVPAPVDAPVTRQKADDLAAAAERAADAAAAASDRAAAYAASVTPPPKVNPAPSTPLPMPQGPALTTEELRTRVLKLIGGLKVARDTEAAQVEPVLGVSLGPDPQEPESAIVEGRLSEAGRYYVMLDRADPTQPGRQINVHFIHKNGRGEPYKAENAMAICGLDFAALNKDIAALGYSGSQGRRFQKKEFWGYRKDFPANDITFYLFLKLYRVMDGSDPKGRLCVRSIEISADDAEVDRG